MRSSALCRWAHFVVLEKNFQIFSLNVWHIPRAICWGVTKGEIKRRQLQEVSFSDLTPQEENQLYTYDTYFEHDEAEKSFQTRSRIVVLLFWNERRGNCKAPWCSEKHDTVSAYKLFWTVKTLFGGTRLWLHIMVTPNRTNAAIPTTA